MGAWLLDEKHYSSIIPVHNFMSSPLHITTPHLRSSTRRRALRRTRTTMERRKEKDQDQRRGGREQNGDEEECGGWKSEKREDAEKW